MDVHNASPFHAVPHLFLDESGKERLLVVVKATWSLQGPKPVVAEEQRRVAVADRYRGDPERSSLIEASDLVPEKPKTDVLVLGCAYTMPQRRLEAAAGFRLGELAKGLRVIGERVWQRGLVGGVVPSEPRPFEKLEVTWERAYGGVDESVPGRTERCQDNPAGVGFRARGSALPTLGVPLPCVENTTVPFRAPTDRPPPAGFGPVAPHWRARSRHAGTYDEDWRRTHYPFLPVDFSPSYYQMAPPDQLYSGYVQGGETMTVIGMTPDGTLSFRLPRLAPRASIQIGRDEADLPEGVCDTVTLDCEARTVSLVWRSSLDVHGKVPRLQGIHIYPGASDAA